LTAYNSARCECGRGRGSTPDPTGGAYSAPQTPWLVLRGRPAGEGGEKGKEGGAGKGRKGAMREMKEKGKRGRDGDGGEGDGSWNRAADWLRPALKSEHA